MKKISTHGVFGTFTFALNIAILSMLVRAGGFGRSANLDTGEKNTEKPLFQAITQSWMLTDREYPW